MSLMSLTAVALEKKDSSRGSDKEEAVLDIRAD